MKLPSPSCSRTAATPPPCWANGTSATRRNSCRRATASTRITACRTPTTCGRITPKSFAVPMKTSACAIPANAPLTPATPSPTRPTPVDWFPPLPLMENEEVIEINPQQELLTAAYTERAVAFIEATASGRFSFTWRIPCPMSRCFAAAASAASRCAGSTATSSKRSTTASGASWRRSKRPASTSRRW